VIRSAGRAVAPCLTPVAELKPVTLRELRGHVGRFAPGRILRLTTLRDATQVVGIQIPAFDDEGTAILVSIYNQTGGKLLSKAQLRRLYPEGSRVLIMHPYVKRGRDGAPMLRVDHPNNVMVETSEGGTRQGATTQSRGAQGAEQVASGVAESCKKRGNDKFQKGDCCGAVEQYDKALNSSDDLAATIHTNRAVCFLKIGQNVDARAAARKALVLDPSNKKALFRLGSAQTALGKHQEAVAAFARLTKDATAGSDVCAALARANRRLAESQGNFGQSVTYLERLHSLYDGTPASASRIPSMKLFRTDDPEYFNPGDHVLDQPPVAVDQVHGIVKYNTFAYREGSGKREIRTGTGLWVLPSFMNHARNPNTDRAQIGDLLLVRAAKPLKRGEEITTTNIYVYGECEGR